ncbi:hypothetical protein D6T64_06960 [Cryobacterium melibiosiphilum]|uniref:Uncharacterized protein n=1 Tax=Cryobacterium melibiosiphilum TaxID=995039 RepID=A0A3A5MQJ9_9MICO|nr:hypothetical protein D6T64_09925 [Cryobacterium melibiosiphilum]RJT89428.1 hypothetical protein D6T64_06960 [Cryobacterium melibiosiphilum]
MESAFAVLRRITRTRPTVDPGPRCEMCGEPIGEPHQHVVDIDSRAMLCTCRPCYLLFTDATAHLRYRSVPDRYRRFTDFDLGAGQWDELEIPVGLAFFFDNAQAEQTIAFYPGPAGATESELPLGAWNAVRARNPGLDIVAPDTEALLVRAPGADGVGPRGAGGGARVGVGSGQFECYLVPIDACYELVGALRRVWRGFDGGQEARAQLTAFFDRVEARSRPAPAGAASAGLATGVQAPARPSRGTTDA